MVVVRDMLGHVTPYKYCLSEVPEINDDTGESCNDCKMANWSVKIAVCQYSFEWTLHIGQLIVLVHKFRSRPSFILTESWKISHRYTQLIDIFI